MNLTDLRTEFIKVSGRNDLPNETIDRFLNAGTKMLDQLLGITPFKSSIKFIDATDTNFWSEEHSLVLIWAALYHLEVSYRNTEGAADWFKSIVEAVARIDKDIAADECDTINQMEG